MEPVMSRIALRKTTLALTAVTIAVCAAIVTTAGPAAATGSSLRIVSGSNRALYLDVSGGSTGDGAKIIQWSLSGDNQVFTLQPSGSYFEFVNRKSGKCVTTDGVVGHQLYQWRCHGTPDQLWDTSLTPLSGYRYSIMNVGSGLYMNVAGNSFTQGAAIDTSYWQGGDNQYFTAYAA
jgi:hypothetical protein